VPPQGGRKHPNQDFLQIDTTNILFICGGAFDGLEKIIQQPHREVRHRFRRRRCDSKTDSATSPKCFSEVEPEDLIKFGLIPELVGRLPVVATLDELDEERAGRRSSPSRKNALVKQYQQAVRHGRRRARGPPAALEAIADKALARKTGARGLRSILEHGADRHDVRPAHPRPAWPRWRRWTSTTIDEGAKPLLVYREQAKASA
jgi:ATP-dependent Clp protease ATP-binding subunit ClpX